MHTSRSLSHTHTHANHSREASHPQPAIVFDQAAATSALTSATNTRARARRQKEGQQASVREKAKLAMLLVFRSSSFRYHRNRTRFVITPRVHSLINKQKASSQRSNRKSRFKNRRRCSHQAARLSRTSGTRSSISHLAARVLECGFGVCRSPRPEIAHERSSSAAAALDRRVAHPRSTLNAHTCMHMHIKGGVLPIVVRVVNSSDIITGHRPQSTVL